MILRSGIILETESSGSAFLYFSSICTKRYPLGQLLTFNTELPCWAQPHMKSPQGAFPSSYHSYLFIYHYLCLTRWVCIEWFEARKLSILSIRPWSLPRKEHGVAGSLSSCGISIVRSDKVIKYNFSLI